MNKEDILNIYSYSKNSGEFGWIGSNSSRKNKPGHITPKGYVRIRVLGRYYPAHHLVWLIENGALPNLQIDHIDGNPANNRIENLREVDAVVNSQNQRRAHKTSKSGLLGASKSYKSWRAQIKVDKKTVHLGQFSTAEEAHDAYIQAKRKMHPGCTI